MALAPRRALLSVPSRSISSRSRRRWSRPSRPTTASAISPLTLATARPTPLPPKRLPPSRSSTASKAPVDAPEGTMARPSAPLSSTTSTSTVGLPRESRTSRPLTCSMMLTALGRLLWPVWSLSPCCCCQLLLLYPVAAVAVLFLWSVVTTGGSVAHVSRRRSPCCGGRPRSAASAVGGRRRGLEGGAEAVRGFAEGLLGIQARRTGVRATSANRASPSCSADGAVASMTTSITGRSAARPASGSWPAAAARRWSLAA